MNDVDRLQTLFEGVFAGNIFDLVPSFFTLPFCLPTQLMSAHLPIIAGFIRHAEVV